MRTRRLITAGAVTALAATFIVGCGSSKSSTTPPSGTATSAGSSTSTGSSAATGTPIVIGSLGEFSGVQAASQAGAPLVLDAWVKSVNDAGGIAGHPVKLITKDLGNNLTGGLAAVKELIQSDHVVAIVGEQDNNDTSWATYAQQSGVPVVGGATNTIPMMTTPDFFPVGGNLFSLVYGTLALAKGLGTKFGNLYCAESPQCAQSDALYKGLGGVLGVTVPVSRKITATQPSYTSECQALKDSGAQSYIVGENSAVVQHVATECAAAGYTAPTISVDGIMTAGWLKTPALDGALDAEGVAPWFDTSVPATQGYQALKAKYLPDLGDKDGPNAFYSYVSGELFKKAVENAGADTVTADTVKQGLYMMQGETLGGLTPPLTFVKDKPTLVNAFFTVGIKGGKFVEPNGIKPTAVPDAIVSGILAQLPKS
ncbi:MAG TPA: ABC transporter substrate-binding protein [Mycobacteriales bacterium]|nr:ABC transporter substrate-binding protein [Mycobacteriales bacterium]